MNFEKGERKPPDVILDVIAKDLLSFFNEFEYFHKVKRTIEKKCDIKKEHKHTCWPEDDIKRAWEETKRMDMKSSRRRNWAYIIILQVVNSFVCDTCKLNPDERGWETTPNPEDRSSESKAEPETVGAAGGVEQTPGEGENISKVSKLTAFSIDVPPLPTEVNPDNSETKNAALMNEDKDILVNICQQQKNVQLHVDVSDKENIRKENGLRSTCGKAQSIKENSEHQRTDVILGSQGENRVDETIYIRIPLSVIAEDEPTDSLGVPNVRSRYKLINGFPSGNTDIRKRKSYAMSFDNNTNNAEWVYEILNRDTLVNNCVQGSFGNGYDRGHLAAVANHRWCRKAYYDTYLYSNMIPQNHSLNIGKWKSLEITCRNMLRNRLIRNVHVYTGPLYIRRMDYQVLGGKVVPSHFFKVIIVENENRTVRKPVCYVIPNEEPTEDLNLYSVSIEYIEHISGLMFLERRPILRETDTIIRLHGEDLNQIQRHADIVVSISL